MFTYFVYSSTQILETFDSEDLAIHECSLYDSPDVNYIAIDSSVVESNLLDLINSLR